MRRVALVGLVVLLAALAAGVPDGDNRPWQDGSRHGPWTAVFNGYGEVRADGDDLLLSPKAPAAEENTHAALVVTDRSYADVAVSVLLKTERQLRQPDPQAWEVGWVLWHYVGEGRFYALESLGHLSWSDDGTNWTTILLPVMASPQALAVGRDVFVAGPRPTPVVFTRLPQVFQQARPEDAQALQVAQIGRLKAQPLQVV